MTAWAATHTGLPSFHVVTTELVRVTCGDRLVAVLEAGEHLFSDPLAAPGSSTYEVGGVGYAVSRVAGAAHEAIFTDEAGRGVAGLLHVNNSDPVSYKPSLSQFNRRVVRWAIDDPPMSGTSVLVLLDAALESGVWRVLRRHARVIVSPAVVTAGVPLRRVVVTGVSRSRVSGDGVLRFEVAWSEADGPAPVAPVVTWGEWAGLGTGWQDLSPVEVAQAVAGMPS